MKNKLIVIMLLFAFAGCKDKEKVYLDPLANSLFGIQGDGSKWVYKNAQMLTDSCEVTEYSKGFSQNVNPVKEAVSSYISSTLPEGDVQYMVTTESYTKTSVNIFTNYPYGAQFTIAFKDGSIDTSETSYTPIENLSNYQVNQYNFQNAIKVYSSNYDFYLVLVPDIGIVEKRLNSTQTPLKLIGYEVKK